MTRPKQPLGLMEQTEKLVLSLVRRARAGRVFIDPETKKTRRVQLDVIDQVRAADQALKFLQVKNKLEPDTEEGEFERAQREYHGKGDGKAAPGSSNGAANGGPTTAH